MHRINLARASRDSRASLTRAPREPHSSLTQARRESHASPTGAPSETLGSFTQPLRVPRCILVTKHPTNLTETSDRRRTTSQQSCNSEWKDRALIEFCVFQWPNAMTHATKACFASLTRQAGVHKMVPPTYYASDRVAIRALRWP
jgi:hypothetical protein